MPALARAFNIFLPDTPKAMQQPKLLDRVRAGFLMWLVLVLVATLFVSCGPPPQAGATAEPSPQAAASPAPPIPWGTIQPPAQVGVPGGTPAAPPQRSPVRTFHGTGVIRSVNLKEGWFEIEHEDIKDYMPAMRMQWTVRDRSILKSVQPGDKVEFTLEDDNGSEVVTGLKKAPAAQ